MDAIWNVWRIMRNSLLVIVSIILCVGCKPTAPQRPVFHGSATVDTAVVNALAFNQKMADEADLLLTRYAQQGYVMTEDNYWIRGVHNQDSTWQEGEFISYEATLFTLEDSLIANHQGHTTLDKVDDIQAIKMVLPSLYKNDSVSMIVPWYLAYGSLGSNQVLPYTNLRIELKVLP